MANYETSADIIAEMRGAKTEFPFVYLMGEPDTPEVIDSKTKEIVEPRKINIRRVTVTELADRLEAANRRERDACAKMRKAIVHMIDTADSIAIREPTGVIGKLAFHIKHTGDAALAATEKEGGAK